MNWIKFNTYGDSAQNAFETMCNQLFERYLKRNYKNELIKFRVINGSGGDGGIEAYGQLRSGEILAVQAKWFQQSLDENEIKQIKKSILTAKQLRPEIKEYIICIPHNVNSLKIGRGKKPTVNHEENKINKLIDDIYSVNSDLKLTWWFDNEILTEIQKENNEGVHKFWFDREVISQDYLFKHFAIQKKGWLHERYIPELHGQGIINKEYQKLCFSSHYRNELLRQATQVINDLKFGIQLIEYFIPSNNEPEINDQLILIKENLLTFLEELKNIANAIQTGNDFYKINEHTEVDIWDTKLKLERLKPNNTQKNLLPKLIKSLDNIYKYNLPEYIQSYGIDFKQKIKLIFGDSGTGKTHGLTNCVESHLTANSPSLIIQAKGAPFSDWSQILSKSLEINWNKDEILSALETLAIKNDVKKAIALKSGEEHSFETTKAIICIDGLEEEVDHQKEWYARIRESGQLTSEYPRVRFIFSARKYYYDSDEVPQKDVFEEVFLPREGDVLIKELAPHYFDKDNYNIQLSPYSLIRGIDSLLSLRLFCEEYQNRSITETDKISTATRDLINLKIDRLNNEFISKLKSKKSSIRNPIMDSLEIISKFFYKKREVEHNQLVSLISPELKNYLDGSEIDSLIEYLVNNAFLIRFERVDNEGIFKKSKHYYSITYQSLIEHIISENIYYDIKSGSLNRIPQFLHNPMIRPFDFNQKESFGPFEISPNEKIIQNIIINSLIESGRLIGEDNFLTEGFDELEIKKYQLKAISRAPNSVAKNFKEKIDIFFHNGYDSLSQVLEYLILPSSSSAESVFGANYLHQTLMNFSVFERDKIWSGLDRSETAKLSPSARQNYHYRKSVFRELGFSKPVLFEWNLHDERPLVFAWGLSSIDQQLRSDLRVSLTNWAIKAPTEFLNLLEKIFHCNDPQIQEDLASITLGVASRLKDKEEIKKLALWSIDNIFNHLNVHRNIIVRQGFRAIAERAYQYDVISVDEVEKCRPKPIQKIALLPIERNLTLKSEGACYPIVHDLAWYVIKNAYKDFLEHPSLIGDELKDNNCLEAKKLLNTYKNYYNEDNISIVNWVMGAAIAYIKSLGFTRLEEEGNWHTQASHGIKSKLFTYEEKYTWLAVHYIQGYLSDYIPLKNWAGKPKFISDYSQIADIPNPAESIIDFNTSLEKIKSEKEWIVKEVLSKELEKDIETNQNITNWVNEEPVFDLEKWLSFNSTDFQIDEPNRNWLALYNYTGLHDSQEIVYTSFYSIACIINKKDLQSLIKILENDPDSLHFVPHLDSMHSSPKTDTYCNPTDIVWMTWLEENDPKDSFYDELSDDEKILHYTITNIMQNEINEETYIRLPSKKIRKLIDCYELLGSELKNSKGQTLAFNYKISDGSYRDNQELVLVDKDALEKNVDNEDCEIVWFIELFKKKNPLNENLDKNFHVQKTRKYFVWKEQGQKKSLKFWDERFSNQRDRDL